LTLIEPEGGIGEVGAGLGIFRHQPTPFAARRIGPSRPEAAILVILENTSGTGWLLLTIAHARNDVPLR